VTTVSTSLVPRRRRRVPESLRSPLTVVGVVVAAVWLLVVVLGPLLQPADPLAQSPDRLAPVSAAHWFGTDSLGRDVLSRVIAGARISIPLSLLLVALSASVGSLLGAVAGLLGGVVDEVVMRIADLVLAFPTIILAMVIAAALGPSLTNAVIAMLVVTWPQYARVTRSLVLGARDREFVVAGRLLGIGWFTSLRRDVVPNVVGPVFALTTLDFGNAILLLSGLSFLGLGTVPPTPEWGLMVSDGVQNFTAWWVAAFPGLAICSIVLAFNFIGDALRDALDPRMQKAVGSRAL
jgi:ABC-type dipeptide/oligopeptide/nickel transport system permease subunit